MIYYIFKKFELMGAENVLMAFHLFHILIKIYLPCRVKVGLKKNIYYSISNLLVTYFYYTIFFQIYTQFTINLM
jgi:hypothetical protein